MYGLLMLPKSLQSSLNHARHIMEQQGALELIQSKFLRHGGKQISVVFLHLPQRRVR